MTRSQKPLETPKLPAYLQQQAYLRRLEEVLVVTDVDYRAPEATADRTDQPDLSRPQPRQSRLAVGARVEVLVELAPARRQALQPPGHAQVEGVAERTELDGIGRRGVLP